VSRAEAKPGRPRAIGLKREVRANDHFSAGRSWERCSAIHMATRCRARTCLCRATRFKRFSVCSSSAIVSAFGGGRRTRTLTGGPSLNSRAKSSSESSSHPTASCFKARRWAAVNFCAIVDTSVGYAAPCPVLSRPARLPYGDKGQLRPPSSDPHTSCRRLSIESLECHDAGREQSMMDGSHHKRFLLLLLALHRAGQCVRCCRRPTPAPAPRIAQLKATTEDGEFR